LREKYSKRDKTNAVARPDPSSAPKKSILILNYVKDERFTRGYPMLVSCS
jgi:hypothetical protein